MLEGKIGARERERNPVPEPRSRIVWGVLEGMGGGGRNSCEEEGER